MFSRFWTRLAGRQHDKIRIRICVRHYVRTLRPSFPLLSCGLFSCFRAIAVSAWGRLLCRQSRTMCNFHSCLHTEPVLQSKWGGVTTTVWHLYAPNWLWLGLPKTKTNSSTYETVVTRTQTYVDGCIRHRYRFSGSLSHLTAFLRRRFVGLCTAHICNIAKSFLTCFI